MSRFYGNMRGSRGEVTRQGSAGSGITAHPRGWNTGIHVSGSEDFENRSADRFEVRLTGGSNGSGGHFPLVTVREVGASKREVRMFAPDGRTLALFEVDPDGTYKGHTNPLS